MAPHMRQELGVRQPQSGSTKSLRVRARGRGRPDGCPVPCTRALRSRASLESGRWRASSRPAPWSPSTRSPSCALPRARLFVPHASPEVDGLLSPMVGSARASELVASSKVVGKCRAKGFKLVADVTIDIHGRIALLAASDASALPATGVVRRNLREHKSSLGSEILHARGEIIRNVAESRWAASAIHAVFGHSFVVRGLPPRKLGEVHATVSGRKRL
jgi:hypothetical protein